MVDQLGKFSHQLATITQPLRELLSKNREWIWGPSQEQAFLKVKEELSKLTVLALYDPQLAIKVSADASLYGLGAVLLQKNQQWLMHPDPYLRQKAGTPRFEKKALTITWASDKFTMYILGKRFTIETDHKPLVPLMSTKHLNSLPP